MLIWALDLATATGFAYGEPGSIPASGSVLLKSRGEPRAVALGNLIAFLSASWSARRPDLLVKEPPMSLQAFLLVHSSEANVRMHHSLHGVVEAMATRFAIKYVIEPHVSTVRKHYIGRANLGCRDATKWEVVLRSRLLGYVPKDCEDEDRCDALANWDYACATYGGKSMSTEKLFLFGERPNDDE